MADIELKIEDGDMVRLANAMGKISERGVYYAVKDSMRGVIAEGELEWKGTLRSELTLRNRWTEGSLRKQGPRGASINSVEGVVGSRADYLQTQEDGGTIRSQGEHGKPVPTKAARIGSNYSRMVRRKNRMSNVDLSKGKGEDFSWVQSTKQLVAVVSRMAYAAGMRHVMITSKDGQRTSIYELSGQARKPKMRRVWNLDHDSVTIKPTKTMEPAMVRAAKNWPRRFEIAFRAQVMRNMKR